MFNTFSGWLFCFGLILVVEAILFWRKGPFFALGIVVPLSFLMPVWLYAPVLGGPLLLQTTAAMVALLAFGVRYALKIRSPLVALDLCVVAMIVVHALSDWHHGNSPVVAALLAYGEWGLPYIAGRYAMRVSGTAEGMAVWVSIVLIVLGIGGAVEAVSGVNCWEVVFGPRPVDGSPLNMSRFGFKRAYGPNRHAIYFGLLMLVLSPWPLILFRWRTDIRERSLAVGSCVSTLLGILASVSRAPLLGPPVMVAVMGAIWSRWCRWALLAVLAASLVWVAADFNGFLGVLEEMGGEKSRETKMVLDGEKVEISSARHRVVLLQVFWPAMREAGWLGYGSAALAQLPPKVPYLPADPKTRNLLRYVDNAYVFYVLRFGWAGAAIFTGWMLIAIWTGIRLSWDRSIGELAGTMAAMIVAVAGALATVWFSYDMGFELLWSYGILAGLRAQQKSTA